MEENVLPEIIDANGHSVRILARKNPFLTERTEGDQRLHAGRADDERQQHRGGCCRR